MGSILNDQATIFIGNFLHRSQIYRHTRIMNGYDYLYLVCFLITNFFNILRSYQSGFWINIGKYGDSTAVKSTVRGSSKCVWGCNGLISFTQSGCQTSHMKG